jgi:prophage DNA circulation protein
MVMGDKYQTNIAGFLLDVETISDSFQKAIAKHEFPHTNGALLEDLGQKGRSISIRCYFGVLGGIASYQDYFKFIKTLDGIDTVEFIHPEEGLLKGRIEKVDKRKNDRQEFAEVDITFLEGRIEAEPVAQISMPGFGEEAFLDGQDELQANFAAGLAGDLGADGAALAGDELDPDTGILEQMSALSGKVRSYVAQVDAAVRGLEATLSAITQPANTLLATVNYAANLPGRVIGSIAATVERYAESYNALRNFPAQFQRSLKVQLDRLEDSFRSFQSKAPAGSARAVAETAAMTRIADQINAASAHRLALEAAYGFATDQTNRLLAKKNESQKSFDSLGNFSRPVPPDPLMTRTDIEAALAVAMAKAQDSINRLRGLTAIKRGISGLVDFSRTIMIGAGDIKQLDIDGTLPLHLILLQQGLPYNAADRVLAINPQIKHPSFVSGTINIYTA